MLVYLLFLLHSSESFLRLRRICLTPIKSRCFSWTKLSSKSNQIDKSKNFVYDKGIIQYCDRNNIKKLGPEVFYNFWNKEFRKLDFRVITDDISTIDQKEFKILGGHTGRFIVLRNSPAAVANYGEITAVFDSLNPFRIFVGQSMMTTYNVDTVGGIIYVDREGRKIDMKTFFATVFSVDFRNARPTTWSPNSPSTINTYLCGDTLMLASFYRWDYFPVLHGVILKEDELNSKFSIHTRIEYPNLNGLQLGRWLCIRRNHRKENEDTLCYDLKSFRFDESDQLLFDRLQVSAAAGGAGEHRDEASPDLIATLNSLQDVPSYDRTNRDGYPVKCIKCGQDTVEGGYSCKNSYIYLGRAVCVHCSIRYSISNKRWECFLADPQLFRCSCSVVAPDYKCSAPHAAGVKYSVKLHEVADVKKGYEQQTLSFEVIQEK